MKPLKVVLTGGPGTGKTSIIKELQNLGHRCFEEVSRGIISQAKTKGIDQLFLTDPLAFSKAVMRGREEQFLKSNSYKNEVIFFDRGIPDILAYMDYKGETYPKFFEEACKILKYDAIFLAPPWKGIYVQDNERYESFDQSVAINNELIATYRRFGYKLMEVPEASIKERTDYILQNLNLNECIH